MAQQFTIKTLIHLLDVLEKETVSGAEMRTLSEILHDELLPVANELCIAAFSGKSIVYPTAYPINGTKELFFTSFELETSRSAHDYVRHVTIGANGYCEIRICPGAGADWTGEIMEDVIGLSRLFEILLERRIMLENAIRMPSIDMTSGLFNAAGLRQAGAQLLAAAPAENYVGLFLNLKDTKVVGQKYGDQFTESYLVAVGHKLFSFLDSDLELAAHFGGDNFYVLLLKERLTSFREFLADAVVEVRTENEPVRLPFSARIGAFAGQPNLPLGAFLSGASAAFQMTRKTGQDYVAAPE